MSTFARNIRCFAAATFVMGVLSWSPMFGLTPASAHGGAYDIDQQADDTVWVDECGQQGNGCGQRPGFWNEALHHVGLRPGLGCCPGCGLKKACHHRRAKDEEPEEDPTARNFPRFHPVPTRPVFALRDEHGMPLPDPPYPETSLGRDDQLAPEEITAPAPMNGSARRGPTSRTPKPLHRASWVFQKGAPPRVSLPPRNPRPLFESVDTPKSTASRQR